MKRYKELPYTKLKKMYYPNHFPFKSTEEISPIEGIVGQERAEKAMQFGLQVKNPRYNIFIAGLKGTGKKSYAQKIIEKNATLENVPDDWCYVYNFDNVDEPIALNFPPGMGKIFSEDMHELIIEFLEEIPKAFNEDQYERKKAEIVKKYQEARNDLLEQLTTYCEENGFTIKSTSKGFALAPIINGAAISDKEYEALEEEQKKEIEKKAEDVELKAAEFLRKMKGVERQAKKSIIALDNNIGQSTVEPLMEDLFDKYKQHPKIITYLNKVKKDVIENIYDFHITEDEQDEIMKDSNNTFVKKYQVNVFIDNSQELGAPVVIETNPNYVNLVGKIEYENEQGSLKTDFTMIKCGAIHKANGGYLILQARQLLSNLQAWDTLKRTLETGQVRIESLRTQLGIVDIASLKPQPIPINMKVILIDNPYVYQLLYTYDEDFEKLFKVKVDFNSEMEVNAENPLKIAQFIRSFCDKEGLKHLDGSGVARMLEYSHRIAGSQKKFTTKFNKLIELLIEADVWAGLEHETLITERHIKKAYVEKNYRNNKIEEKIEEMYKQGKVLIEVEGAHMGRINGLSVIDVGDHMFGKPSMITVTTFAGNKGVVNIEREADMSGRIHDKGIMILEGYLNEKFAQEYALTLTAKICFEQSYSGVDGDSASSTELYGLLSSLSNIPLKQYIAVTGSVNQKGEIQPVGGVTEKIEGFFSLCKYFGLTGKQGVIIPYQNIEDLVLCDEVIEAVEKGQFHVYPVTNIEEGMEILTDKSFNEISEAVKKKLKYYHDNIEQEKDRKKNSSKILRKR
ncbi:ATP-binding protein [Clostridiaceae bacterium 35-E11]